MLFRLVAADLRTVLKKNIITFYCNCGSDRCELGVRLRIVFCVWG
mgnify:CR=1 FL=1